MADPTVTATQVQHISGPEGAGTAGATIAAGQFVYRDDYTQKILLADANVSAAAAAAVGVATTGASAGQRVVFSRPGAIVDFGAGAGLLAGLPYILSVTAGGISPCSDADTPDAGEFSTVACIGIGNNRALIVCAASGVAAA